MKYDVYFYSYEKVHNSAFENQAVWFLYEKIEADTEEGAALIAAKKNSLPSGQFRVYEHAKEITVRRFDSYKVG